MDGENIGAEAEGGEAEKVGIESGSESLIKWFKVNHGFLVLYVFAMAINGFCVAWTTGGYN